uniref:Uncharacterized protein n=1 Tax=Anguilla anguilla TaxID=7936 RepID=A0A0E9R3M8_ANGAN
MDKGCRSPLCQGHTPSWYWSTRKAGDGRVKGSCGSSSTF